MRDDLLEERREHLHHNGMPVEGCNLCAVRPMIGDLYRVWLGRLGADARARLAELVDADPVPVDAGTGEMAWAAVTRSSPEAIIAMWDDIYGAGID